MAGPWVPILCAMAVVLSSCTQPATVEVSSFGGEAPIAEPSRPADATTSTTASSSASDIAPTTTTVSSPENPTEGRGDDGDFDKLFLTSADLQSVFGTEWQASAVEERRATDGTPELTNCPSLNQLIAAFDEEHLEQSFVPDDIGLGEYLNQTIIQTPDANELSHAASQIGGTCPTVVFSGIPGLDEDPFEGAEAVITQMGLNVGAGFWLRESTSDSVVAVGFIVHRDALIAIEVEDSDAVSAAHMEAVLELALQRLQSGLSLTTVPSTSAPPTTAPPTTTAPTSVPRTTIPPTTVLPTTEPWQPTFSENPDWEFLSELALRPEDLGEEFQFDGYVNRENESEGFTGPCTDELIWPIVDEAPNVFGSWAQDQGEREPEDALWISVSQQLMRVGDQQTAALVADDYASFVVRCEVLLGNPNASSPSVVEAIAAPDGFTNGSTVAINFEWDEPFRGLVLEGAYSFGDVVSIVQVFAYWPEADERGLDDLLPLMESTLETAAFRIAG